MKNFSKKNGFTMVELMVSVGITAVMMVGIASFFSATFRNMFDAREKVSNTQGQFVVNTIVDGKFANVGKLQQLGPSGSYAILKNDMDSGDLPFTYIGTQANGDFDQIIFKDFFVFNGKDGTKSSQGAQDTDTQVIGNPGGITELNGNYYLTSPLENKVYRCTDGGPPVKRCSDLGITGLDQPMGITDNGKTSPSDFLYITDAGNNRVVLVRDPTGAKDFSTEITSELNYPTGIEFYSYGGSDYVFVADTYNHVVKKIKTSDSSSEVVVGDGDDEVCNNDGRDHSAKYCKLSFPTGLMIYDDGNGDELYISDTGNGRVLKMSDAGPASDDVEFIVDLENDTQISKIDFALPNGSTINSVQEGASGNTLHKGKYTDDGNETITYNLTVAYNTQDLFPSGCPLNCVDNFRGFYLHNADDDIFELNDDVEIESSSYSVSNLASPTYIRVTPWNTTLPGDGKDVTVTNLFPSASGPYSFFVDLSDATLPGGFQQISVEPYDENPSPLAASTVTLRIGDGELGTDEDTVSLVSDGHDFPTGLGWSGGLDLGSGSADYSTSFSNYDYTSNFDVQNFEFDVPNPNQILELKFDAILNEDDDGQPVWEEFTLNADI